MKVEIYSRPRMETLLRDGIPKNTAVISFYDPPNIRTGQKSMPIDFSDKVNRLFAVAAYDIDIDILGDFGLTYETYFPEADRLADFIRRAYKDGLDLICQCEYGQSRSAACAAAILEHYEKNGISVFADYRYYPNQLLFNKIKNALDKGASSQ